MSIAGQPQSGPLARIPVHYRVIGALVLALALFKAFGPSADDMVRWAKGSGHVAWNELEWRARQTASAAKKPLLIYRVDPRHPAKELFVERVLPDPRVQERAEVVIWHRAEAQADGEPAVPMVQLYDCTGERLIAEQPGPDVTPATFVALIDQAVAANDALIKAR